MDKDVTGWSGWVIFAAFVMMFQGLINFFYGLGAVLNAHWYVYASGTTFLADISSWGWWMILIGMFLGLSGALLLVGNWFGRAMGVIFAVLSLLANIAVFGLAPVWSTIAIVLDVIVVYAILAHGGETKALAHQ